MFTRAGLRQHYWVQHARVYPLPLLGVEGGTQTGYSRYALTSDLGEMEIFEMEVILASTEAKLRCYGFG